MMKKNLIAVALLASSVIASSAQAADGTVNFVGSITDAACAVSAASLAQTVNLGTISATSFGAAGATAADTRFAITLTNCPEEVLANASLRFGGPTDPANSSLLALTGGTDVATGVGVGIYEVSGSPLPLGTASVSKPVSQGNDTVYEFVAKYVATAAAVTVGTANAVSDFTVTYN